LIESIAVMIATSHAETSLIIRTAESLGTAQAHLMSLLIMIKVYAPELLTAESHQHPNATIHKINQFVVAQTGVNVLDR